MNEPDDYLLTDYLSSKEVNDFFIYHLQKGNFAITNHLLETETNECKASFDNKEVMSNINLWTKTTEILISNSKHTSILEYILNKENFLLAATPEVLNNIIDICKSYNSKLIHLCIKSPLFDSYFKDKNCFDYASRYGNIELLDIYFEDINKYSILSYEENIKICLETSVKNKMYHVVHHLINMDSNILEFDFINSISKKSNIFKEIVNEYKFYSTLEDKIILIDNKSNRIKKKI